MTWNFKKPSNLPLSRSKCGPKVDFLVFCSEFTNYCLKFYKTALKYYSGVFMPNNMAFCPFVTFQGHLCVPNLKKIQ